MLASPAAARGETHLESAVEAIQSPVEMGNTLSFATQTVLASESGFSIKVQNGLIAPLAWGRPSLPIPVLRSKAIGSSRNNGAGLLVAAPALLVTTSV
ncbi:MAG: hypothetical protein BWX84_02614 [Verrucomicrobia bacterium ADurb.Bin118]|nr:MAG: hypothetical protein BWX84_02614 [Verrucomicrobia bacterium ADurb.Bin118]